MLDARMTMYPWDLADGGPQAVLDRLRGEIGVNGVSLIVGTPPCLHVRSGPEAGRGIRTAGGWFFTPSESHYAATRARPLPGDLSDARRAVEAAVDLCARIGLSLCFQLSAAHCGPLAARHPELSTKNAFGMASAASLCLINPEVQGLLLGAVADLSSRGSVAAVLLEDFSLAWSEADSAELETPIPLDDLHRQLLKICFCESCHQRAGASSVDAPVALRMVRTALQGGQDSEPLGASRLRRPLAIEVVERLTRWQSAELGSFLRRLRAAAQCPVWVLDHAKNEKDPFRVHAAADVIRIDHPTDLRDSIPDKNTTHRVAVTPAFFRTVAGPNLVAWLVEAMQRDIRSVSFEHFGVLGETEVTSLKQALRFARRA